MDSLFSLLYLSNSSLYDIFFDKEGILKGEPHLNKDKYREDGSINWEYIQKFLEELIDLLNKLDKEGPLLSKDPKGEYPPFYIVDDHLFLSLAKIIKEVVTLSNLSKDRTQVKEIKSLLRKISDIIPIIQTESELLSLRDNRDEYLSEISGLTINGGIIPHLYSSRINVFNFPRQIHLMTLEVPKTSRGKLKLMDRSKRIMSDFIVKSLSLVCTDKSRLSERSREAEIIELSNVFGTLGKLAHCFNISPKSIDIPKELYEVFSHDIEKSISTISKYDQWSDERKFLEKEIIHSTSTDSLYFLTTRISNLTYDLFKRIILKFPKSSHKNIEFVMREMAMFYGYLDPKELDSYFRRLIAEIGESELFKIIGKYLGNPKNITYDCYETYNHFSPLLHKTEVVTDEERRHFMWEILNDYFPSVKLKLTDSIKGYIRDNVEKDPQIFEESYTWSIYYTNTNKFRESFTFSINPYERSTINYRLLELPKDLYKGLIGDFDRVFFSRSINSATLKIYDIEYIELGIVSRQSNLPSSEDSESWGRLRTLMTVLIDCWESDFVRDIILDSIFKSDDISITVIDESDGSESIESIVKYSKKVYITVTMEKWGRG